MRTITVIVLLYVTAQAQSISDQLREMAGQRIIQMKRVERQVERGADSRTLSRRDREPLRYDQKFQNDARVLVSKALAEAKSLEYEQPTAFETKINVEMQAQLEREILPADIIEDAHFLDIMSRKPKE